MNRWQFDCLLLSWIEISWRGVNEPIHDTGIQNMVKVKLTMPTDVPDSYSKG